MAESAFNFVFLTLAIFILATKVSHYAMKKLNGPLVLGEIFVGLLLGPSILGFLVLGDKTSDFLKFKFLGTTVSELLSVSQDEIALTADIILFLAELGAILLLFETGLEIDIRGLRRQGKESTLIASGGILFPFLGGFLLLLLAETYIPELVLPGSDVADAALFLGVTLTATSIGISIRTLMDLNQLDPRAAKTLIGAAIIDDILALLLLTLTLSYFEEKSSIDFMELAETGALILGFFIFAIIFNNFMLPRLINLIGTPRDRYLILMIGLSIVFGFAWLASRTHLAAIIGAFVAGLIVSQHEEFSDRVQEQLPSTSQWVVPIFFIAVGLRVDLASILTPEALLFTIGLFLVAILTKIIGSVVGSLFFESNLRESIAIGVGMAARGEVLLVFAATGLIAGVLSPMLYSSIIDVTILCAITVPLLLRFVLKSEETADS
ncbi:MAG: cation:proton antiporter, partial [Candidatus Hodarchaeales archaeon]